MLYHFTYKTTNTINDKSYYGKHSTTNLEDGYLGSGLNLSRAIKKYGREVFTTEILFFYENTEELNNAEKELITEEMINSNTTYNIAVGGQGGNLGLLVNKKISQKTKGVKKGPCSDTHRKNMRLAKLGYVFSDESLKRRSTTVKEKNAKLTRREKAIGSRSSGEKNGFYNKSHSAEFKENQRNRLLTRSIPISAKSVTINGITYSMMMTAMKELGVNRRTLLKLIGEK